MVDGPGSSSGGCPLRRPLNPSGSNSLLLVKYCLMLRLQGAVSLISVRVLGFRMTWATAGKSAGSRHKLKGIEFETEFPQLRNRCRSKRRR